MRVGERVNGGHSRGKNRNFLFRYLISQRNLVS